jgi:hypothetical protein
MRNIRERSNAARAATAYAIETSRETGAPVFISGDPFTHALLAMAVDVGTITVGLVGGYRATSYTGDGWVVTSIEAP